jgi:CheY-like chemotaxis protein
MRFLRYQMHLQLFCWKKMRLGVIDWAITLRLWNMDRLMFCVGLEDHEDTNRSLTNLLRRRGYHVKSALNLESALKLSDAEQFDVLISDLALPDGSGIELMRKLSSNQTLLGIALTGFGMEQDIRKSKEAGFQHHLVKPIDLNKLDALIQQGAPAPAAA